MAGPVNQASSTHGRLVATRDPASTTKIRAIMRKAGGTRSLAEGVAEPKIGSEDTVSVRSGPRLIQLFDCNKLAPYLSVHFATFWVKTARKGKDHHESPVREP